jgi:hypothetical protein
MICGTLENIAEAVLTDGLANEAELPAIELTLIYCFFTDSGAQL